MKNNIMQKNQNSIFFHKNFPNNIFNLHKSAINNNFSAIILTKTKKTKKPLLDMVYVS
jgi:hypothetical protein